MDATGLLMIQGSLTFSFLGGTLDQLIKYYAYIREKKMKAEKELILTVGLRILHQQLTHNSSLLLD